MKFKIILKGFFFVYIFLLPDVLSAPVRILPYPGFGFLDLGLQWNVWHQKYENKKKYF